MKRTNAIEAREKDNDGHHQFRGGERTGRGTG